MNNKKVFVALIVIAIIAIGLGIYLTSSKPVNEPVNKLGGFTVESGDCLIENKGGVEMAYCSKGFTATSSTMVSFKNPWFGSFKAALVTFTAHGTTTPATAGGMGNQLIDLATSTTALGSSTPSYFIQLPVNLVAGEKFWRAVWNGSATTTNVRVLGESPSNTGETNNVIGISEYLNLRVSTTTAPGTFGTYESGVANAVFQKI